MKIKVNDFCCHDSQTQKNYYIFITNVLFIISEYMELKNQKYFEIEVNNYEISFLYLCNKFIFKFQDIEILGIEKIINAILKVNSFENENKIKKLELDRPIFYYEDGIFKIGYISEINEQETRVWWGGEYNCELADGDDKHINKNKIIII